MMTRKRKVSKTGYTDPWWSLYFLGTGNPKLWNHGVYKYKKEIKDKQVRVTIEEV